MVTHSLRRLALSFTVVGGAAYLLAGLVQDVDERGFDRAVVVVAVAAVLASVAGLVAIGVAAAWSFLRQTGGAERGNANH